MLKPLAGFLKKPRFIFPLAYFFLHAFVISFPEFFNRAGTPFPGNWILYFFEGFFGPFFVATAFLKGLKVPSSLLLGKLLAIVFYFLLGLVLEFFLWMADRIRAAVPRRVGKVLAVAFVVAIPGAILWLYYSWIRANLIY